MLPTDKQKPTVDRCFSPLPVVSPDLYTEVTWEEPIFSDNSGQPVRIRRSHVPGLFQQGLTEVTYTAYDDSGNNNTCTLKINVIRKTLSYLIWRHFNRISVIQRRPIVVTVFLGVMTSTKCSLLGTGHFSWSWGGGTYRHKESNR